MTKHSFPNLSSPKSVLQLCIVIVSFCASFPTDAAKPGGGTTTTMVLTYTYGAPARWVARVDPPDLKAFQLSVMFDKSSLAANTITGRVPFDNNLTFNSTGFGVTVAGSTVAAQAKPGDVDIFELVFTCGAAGCLGPVPMSENFDGVVPPALPANWTANNAVGAAPLWVTSNSATPAPSADSAPNAAFINDPATVSDKRLVSPSIAIPAGGGLQLNFRQNYALQDTFDGGVLEISIGGGAFADIITAGGSFVTGGYNSTLSNSFGNPLGGRMAWTGASGGFITTTINLPAAAAGQNIALRWRMGSDTSVSGQGWIVDTVSISGVPPQPPFMAFANGPNDSLTALQTVLGPVLYHNSGTHTGTQIEFTVPTVLTAGELYEVDVTQTSGDFDAIVSIRDPSNNLVVDDQDTDINEVVRFIAPVTGANYHILVDRFVPTTGNFNVDLFHPALTPQQIVYDFAQIAPTTRVFTPGVFPHIWDPDGVYNSGHTGGSGNWDTSSISWDDLPSGSQPLEDTRWINATHARDIAVFGGDPGPVFEGGPKFGNVTVEVPISVGGFQFDISGYHIQGDTLTLMAPSGLTPTIDTGANNAMISSSIAGSSGLTKIGTGTLTLTGSNTYTGPTTVNAGTLLVAGGSATGNTSVMVNNGGCVGGNGTINGPVNVSAGGSVFGGNGTIASNLTLANNLNLSDESIIKVALGPGGSHSTLHRAGGAWNFDTGQAVTIVNLGAQPGFYNNIISGLAADPGNVGSWHIINQGFNGSFVYDGSGNIDLNVSSVPPPLTLVSAFSRKDHGFAGPLSIPLSLSSPFSVECRDSGGNHSLIFIFSNFVLSGSAIVATTGTGSVSNSSANGNTTMTVNLTGVSDAQLVTVMLRGVTDTFGQVLPDTAVSVYMLAGDTNGNKVVNATDVSQTRLQSGALVTNANCRQDVVISGTINATDVSFVRLRAGSGVSKPAR